MRELLRHLVADLREPLLREGPFGLTLWQCVAAPALVALALGLGALLGRLTRALLVRMARMTRVSWDDLVAQSLGGPLMLAWTIAVLWFANPILELSKAAEHLFDQLLRGGLYATLFWACSRAIGVAGVVVATSEWGVTHTLSRSLVPLGARVARIALFALGLVILFSELGVPVTSLLAGLGVGGLAIALAAQKTFENLIGAFSIGADQPFTQGDFVKIEDFVGTVERIGLRSTRFRTLDRTLITIPNGKLADMRIESFTARDRFRLFTTLSLVRETTPAQLRQVLAEVEALLRSHPTIWPDAVTVRFVRLGEASLDIDVMAWFVVPDFAAFQVVRQDVLIEILRLVQDAGSSFAYPTQVLRVAEGTQHPAAPRPGGGGGGQGGGGEPQTPPGAAS